MKRKFIIDKEVNLNESDFLQTKTYSDNLRKVIENTEENKVFTIGLFGSWGSGKSSIIETALNEFDQSKVKFINYDAWQYCNDSFRRMFLRKVRRELGFDETELMKKFYENESADIGNKFQLSTTRLSWILGGILLAIGLIWVFPFKFDLKMPIYSMLTLIGLFITVMSGAFHQLKISITKPLFFAPEQFENCFKEMVSISLKKYRWYEKIKFTIAGDKTLKNLEKLVIVIDNIDRCNNDVAYQLLTDIKTFLASDNYSIVFVIPVDDEALRKHLFRLNNHNDEDISVKEKEEFLRKFFNVVIRIKPYLETDMFSFAKKVNEKYKLGFKMDTLNLAAKEYSTNPRRVIQLFNNLLSDLSNYPEAFAEEQETLICAIIILREEFSGYYKEVVNSPKIFLEDTEYGELPIPQERERIERFNRITRSIRANVSPSELTYILTNSNSIFYDLPADVKDSIESFDSAKVLEAIKNEPSRVFEFIVHKTKFCVQNVLNSDLANYFDMVAQLSQGFEIDRPTIIRLNDDFEQKIDYIIEKTSNHENLCKYALFQEKQNLPRLKRRIIDKINNTNSGLDFWPKLFNAALKYFSDNDTSLKLSATYTGNFKLVNTDIKFSKEQYMNLINQEFIQNRIGELDNLSLSANSYRMLADVLPNKENLNPSTSEKLFERINQLIGDTFNKSAEEIIEIVDYTNAFMILLPDKTMANDYANLKALYDKIIQRKVAHANYPNHRNYDIQVDLIDDSISIDERLEKCIIFIVNIYRLTNGNLSVVELVNKLSEKRSLINPALKELAMKGFALQEIWEFVFADSGYDNITTLDLLKHVFSLTKDNEYLVSIDRALGKFDSLLVYANDHRSNDVYKLLEEVAELDYYKKPLVDCIVNKPASFINGQPAFIHKLAINSFDSANHLGFKDNFSFLEVIAANGTQTQVHYLVLILNQKLDSNERFSEVVSVASQIKNIKQTDKNLLKSHLESLKENHQEGMTEEEKGKLKGLIKQFG